MTLIDPTRLTGYYAQTTVRTNVSVAGSVGSASFATELADKLASTDAMTREDATLALYDWYRQYARSVFELLFPTDEANTSGAAGGFKSLDEIGAEFRSDFDRLGETMNTLFAAAGLSFTADVSIRLDGVGGLDVTGQERTAGQVNALLTETDGFVAQFAVMAARGALTEAARSVDGFAESYATDPAATVKDYIGDLERLLLGFTMTAGGDGMGYHF